jgi:hypothetical protein
MEFFRVSLGVIAVLSLMEYKREGGETPPLQVLRFKTVPH